MGTEPEQVGARPKGGTGKSRQVDLAGPDGGVAWGSCCGGCPLWGLVPVLPPPPRRGVGFSGQWGDDRWLTPVTLRPWSPPARLSSEWKGDWVGGGSFPVSWEICQVESSLPTFVTITPLLYLFSLFPPLPLFHLHSPLFSLCLSLTNCSLFLYKVEWGCGL